MKFFPILILVGCVLWLVNDRFDMNRSLEIANEKLSNSEAALAKAQADLARATSVLQKVSPDSAAALTRKSSGVAGPVASAAEKPLAKTWLQQRIDQRIDPFAPGSSASQGSQKPQGTGSRPPR